MQINVTEPVAIHKMKTVFYYGDGESEEAKRLAAVERAEKRVGLTRDASAFDGQIENCNKVVILPNVRPNDRKKIEGAYGGDLIVARGSDKWAGGEINVMGGPHAKTSVVLPDSTVVTGPKANPEEVSLAMAEANTVKIPVQEPRRRGRPPGSRNKGPHE